MLPSSINLKHGLGYTAAAFISAGGLEKRGKVQGTQFTRSFSRSFQDTETRQRNYTFHTQSQQTSQSCLKHYIHSNTNYSYFLCPFTGKITIACKRRVRRRAERFSSESLNDVLVNDLYVSSCITRQIAPVLLVHEAGFSQG